MRIEGRPPMPPQMPEESNTNYHDQVQNVLGMLEEVKSWMKRVDFKRGFGLYSQGDNQRIYDYVCDAVGELKGSKVSLENMKNALETLKRASFIWQNDKSDMKELKNNPQWQKYHDMLEWSIGSDTSGALKELVKNAENAQNNSG